MFRKTHREIDNKVSHFDEYLSDPSVLSDYKMMSHIGKGCFSTVSLAVHKETGQNYAMKTYEKVDGMEWYRLDSIKREIKHLKRLEHPNVVRLISVVKDKKKLQLLMDNGGKQSLSGLLRKSKRFSEENAKMYMKQIIEAISYCHERGVSHRDIKPENILVNDEGFVTVIDFGFSASSNTKLTTYCGTPPFMCPEITKKVPYSGAAADVWALGILLYMLVMGGLPFRATNEAELYRLIQQGKYPKREVFSKGLRNLLDKMLCTDPTNRIASKNLLSEPWLK